MADLGEAFNTMKFNKQQFQTIDYFFTQKTLIEDIEQIDKNMNRETKKIKIIKNFLALNIPTLITTISANGQTLEKPLGFDIEIFGDEGYHYKGSITSYQGIIPNFMIPIKNDKKLFVNINYNLIDNIINNNNQSYENENNILPNSTVTKKFVNFIEVPKRYQNVDDL
jgi:hypothetical protein